MTPDEDRRRAGETTAEAAEPLLPAAGEAVLLYAAKGREVPLESLWRVAGARGCRIGLPVVVSAEGESPKMIACEVAPDPDQANLRLGERFGIREPDWPNVPEIPLTQLRVVFVPGLLFDPSGRRLGQGGGFYDAFMAQLPATCLRVGVGDYWQLVDGPLPVEAHDAPVDELIIAGRMTTIVRGTA